MADMTFDEVVRLAEQLPLDQQNKLIARLRIKQVEHTLPRPTREELIHELENRRAAGAFNKVESLYGAFANPNSPELSEEEFHAQLHAIATEWEQELDEF